MKQGVFEGEFGVGIGVETFDGAVNDIEVVGGVRPRVVVELLLISIKKKSQKSYGGVFMRIVF
jgi:hypothetical protein